MHAKIYKIVCHTTNKMYIGSTCLSLKDRLAAHVSQINHRNSPVNTILLGGNYKIYLLRSYTNINHYHLLLEEGKLQRRYNSVNTKIAGRSQHDWYVDNSKRIKRKRNKKVKCPKCRIMVNQSSMTRHRNSQKHKSKK